VVRACLAQFEGVQVNQHLWPMVRSGRELKNVLKGIRDHPGAVLFTLVNETTRLALMQECMTLNVPCISVIDPVIEGLGKYFHQTKSGRPGGQHMLNADYFNRIDAMNFVMSHDDGQSAWNLHDADIVLIGVSRTSKTPTSIYLANHWGIKSANVPFVPDLPLPPELFELNGPFCVGLTAAPDRLIQIRRNRLLSLHQDSESDYIDPEVVKREIADARKLFTKQNWPVIDVTRRSIEEIASSIYKLYSQHQDDSAARETAAGD
jgi:[pyruvate, water dikinase]-phosphate phosphotransferase / [pyruvate, water dikinase] kinase